MTVTLEWFGEKPEHKLFPENSEALLRGESKH